MTPLDPSNLNVASIAIGDPADGPAHGRARGDAFDDDEPEASPVELRAMAIAGLSALRQAEEKDDFVMPDHRDPHFGAGNQRRQHPGQIGVLEVVEVPCRHDVGAGTDPRPPPKRLPHRPLRRLHPPPHRPGHL